MDLRGEESLYGGVRGASSDETFNIMPPKADWNCTYHGAEGTERLVPLLLLCSVFLVDFGFVRRVQVIFDTSSRCTN